MESDLQSRAIAVLKIFADGEERDVQSGSRMDIKAVTWLFNNGHLQGIDASDFEEKSYMSLVITKQGLEKLEQFEKEQKSNPGREASYQAKHPIRAAVVVLVAGGLLLAAALAYFSWVTHDST